ncbi:MAG: DNA gyrase inhibitor YacG [Pseudomonadota bacterium]|nr:DNA gyrase inhibitor YacG [Pseudomonadota bacterium]
MKDSPLPPITKPRTVRCPACGGPSVYVPENRYRPFCSERCKLHDLGAWASESFRVEVQENDGAEESPAP